MAFPGVFRLRQGYGGRAGGQAELRGSNGSVLAACVGGALSLDVDSNVCTDLFSYQVREMFSVYRSVSFSGSRIGSA
jgi:hypothetical protein